MKVSWQMTVFYYFLGVLMGMALCVQLAKKADKIEYDCLEKEVRAYVMEFDYFKVVEDNKARISDGL